MNHVEFFGLQKEPFRITPDRNFFYPAKGHTALREVIRYGLENGEGFIIITGEVGTGKTLLLRMMMNDLSDRFETALILSPYLSRQELLRAILRDLELQVPAEDQSLDTLLRVLNDHLCFLTEQGKRLVVVIDEAQNLPEESLEQLRLLSNFETDTQKLLQIILFGQPELRDKLAQPSMRQFLQRITIMETLVPLNKQEMVHYILHRLKTGGMAKLPRSLKATNLLWRYTKGYPRLINKVMGRALLVAYGEKERVIGPRIVREAIESFNLQKKKKLSQRPLFRLGFAALTLLFALGGWLILAAPPSLQDEMKAITDRTGTIQIPDLPTYGPHPVLKEWARTLADREVFIPLPNNLPGLGGMLADRAIAIQLPKSLRAWLRDDFGKLPPDKSRPAAGPAPVPQLSPQLPPQPGNSPLGSQ